MKKTLDITCPCGSGLTYDRCCGPCLDNRAAPNTAEALMRSRYTAYTHQDAAYLLRSWHASTRPAELTFAQEPPVTWLGLKVLRTEAGGINDDNGLVEFVARYKVNGKAQRLHETSRFVKEDGRWYYVDGEVDA
ncbi:MAG: hypothetical protein GC149_12015 [Gammaproteobacteria bacterium]|nr:hypothetical protein [Gammaproteobacteria bacterium]